MFDFMAPTTRDRVTTAARVQNYRAYMTAIGAPLTRANLLRLAAKNEQSARRLTPRTAVSRDQKLAALQQARTFYALARAARD